MKQNILTANVKSSKVSAQEKDDNIHMHTNTKNRMTVYTTNIWNLN